MTKMLKIHHYYIVFLSVMIGFFLLGIGETKAVMPNDPVASQWAYEHIGLYKAWDHAIGASEVVVAVIDNGVDFLHPDLEANAWKNVDEVPNNDLDDDNNGYTDDVWGWNFVDNNGDPRPNVDNLSATDREDATFNHGTLVAGLIGATGNNGLDGVGVNWHVKIMSIKILDNDGEGDIVPLSPAILYAVDNGAKVINISAVGFENGDRDDISQAIKYAYEKGVVVVAAAGNGNTFLNETPLYPICADLGSVEQMVLGVSAIGFDHRLTLFSNTGSDCVDITAPGIDVTSTVRFSPTNGLTQRYGGGWSGTSFAAPLVSGAAALIKSIQPDWGAKEIYTALLSTIHHTPGQNEVVYANLFGKGLLQIDKAVKYAVDRINSVRSIKTIVVVRSKTGSIIKKTFGENTKSKIDKKEVAKLLSSEADVLVSSIKEIKGDFDRDGQDESVVLENPADPGYFTVRDHDGRLMFDFSAFDGLKKGAKVELLAGDYNGDGTEELVVAVLGRSIGVWSLFPLRRLEEWSIGKDQKNTITLIGY